MDGLWTGGRWLRPCFLQTLVQKHLLQQVHHCSSSPLVPNWMPLILYEQRGGPSWCGGSNGPSSGSHIDHSFCEAAGRLSVGSTWKTIQHERKEKSKKISWFISSWATTPDGVWPACWCHANCNVTGSETSVGSLNGRRPAGRFYVTEEIYVYSKPSPTDPDWMYGVTHPGRRRVFHQWWFGRSIRSTVEEAVWEGLGLNLSVASLMGRSACSI